MTTVPFNEENVMKCICGKCPVTKNSKCSKELMEKAHMMMKEGKKPSKKDIPGLYCASGKAHCKDLAFGEMCICGKCPLWTEYKLPNGMPMGYYCRDGAAK